MRKEIRRVGNSEPWGGWYDAEVFYFDRSSDSIHGQDARATWHGQPARRSLSAEAGSRPCQRGAAANQKTMGMMQRIQRARRRASLSDYSSEEITRFVLMEGEAPPSHGGDECESLGGHGGPPSVFSDWFSVISVTRSGSHLVAAPRR